MRLLHTPTPTPTHTHTHTHPHPHTHTHTWAHTHTHTHTHRMCPLSTPFLLKSLVVKQPSTLVSNPSVAHTLAKCCGQLNHHRHYHCTLCYCLRHHRSRGSREVNCGEGHLWCAGEGTHDDVCSSAWGVWPVCEMICSTADSLTSLLSLQTVRFKNELVRNITIKLGYANAKVRE